MMKPKLPPRMLKNIVGLFFTLFLTSLFIPNVQAASACGDAGQRACCTITAEATSPCNGTNVETFGGTVPTPTLCGGDNGLELFSSISRCEQPVAISSCGGEGERACCLLEETFGACQDGLVEVAGNSPAPRMCGGVNPLGILSNGHCAICGTEGAPKCTGPGITLSNECKPGLTANFFSICNSCGGEGQPLCRDAVEDFMCARGYHPNGGVCKKDQTIEEPSCNCEADYISNAVDQPVKGYADLHLHMFSNLGFGGLTLWGDAFDESGGISQALRADNFAQRTSDFVINGHVKKGINKDKEPIDLFRKQQLIHGDMHFDDIVGGGNYQQDLFSSTLAEGGVEWNPDKTTHFAGWPKWNSVTHQQSYYKWLERAHRGGLQLAVMMAVTNESLCISGRSLDYPEHGCAKSKSAIDMQIQKAKDMEDFLNRRCRKSVNPSISPVDRAELITACSFPGSGIGWFKIVKTPQEARVAISKGQLAVILGIEEANLFDCNDGLCTPEYVQGQVDYYYEKGVRHIFPIHNFDNDYGGAATWMSTIAVGNTYATKVWHEVENCPDTPSIIGNDSGYGFKLEPDISNALASLVLATGWELPEHYTGLITTCNQSGLKPLGKNLVTYLMKKGMIIDLDHMSIKAVSDTLDLAEANEYPGIVASHTLMFDLTKKSNRHERMRTKDQLQRMAALGGMIGAMTQPPEGSEAGPGTPVTIQQWSESAVNNDCQASSKTWAQMYEWATKEINIPVAFGTDFNGISRHNAPRFGDDACDNQETSSAQLENTRMTYPFDITSFGSFDKQETGGRIFDYNEDGLAHVGMLPDMTRDLLKVGLSEADLEPLFQSAEAYISMWEGSDAATVNVEQPSTRLFKDEDRNPTISISLNPPQNENGWNNTLVIARMTAEDNAGGAGVSSVNYRLNATDDFTRRVGSTYQLSILDEGVTQLEYKAKDLAFNHSASQTTVIKIDRVKPQVFIGGVPRIIDSSVPAIFVGWNTKAVAVTLRCEDALSGIASCEADKPVLFNEDGRNQSITVTGVDNAGNTSSKTLRFNIDTTPPVVTINGITDKQFFQIGKPLPEISCSTRDAVSGVRTSAILTMTGAVVTDQVGEFTVTCSGALDKAGNKASASLVYSVSNLSEALETQEKVKLAKTITSNTVTVAGIAPFTQISVLGGSYSINGGAFTDAAGIISNGDSIQIQQTSAAANGVTTETVVSIGDDITEVFSSTTEAAVEVETAASSSGGGSMGILWLLFAFLMLLSTRGVSVKRR